MLDIKGCASVISFGKNGNCGRKGEEYTGDSLKLFVSLATKIAILGVQRKNIGEGQPVSLFRQTLHR